MYRIFGRGLPALFLLCANASRADPLTLAQAISQAQVKSPDIQSVQGQYDSALAKKRLALAPAEPSLAINWNDMTTPFGLGGTASQSFQLTQTLGFPGRAWLSRAELDDQAEATGEALRSIKLQVSTNVKQAYYGLALAQKNIALNEDQRLSCERILAVAKRRYEAGASSQVDLLNAQVALLQNTNDLADLEAAEKQARAQLNVLLKNPEDAKLDVAPLAMEERPAIDLDQALARMLENRPEIKAARDQVAASDRAYDLAWMQLLPDFQLTAGTTLYKVPQASPYSNTPDASVTGLYPSHTYMAGVQIQIPLWFFVNERETIVAASHDRAAAEANLDVQFEQSRVALVNAVEGINAFRLKIKNYEEHMLPMAEQSLNVALTAYGAGGIDFQTLSDTATARRQIRLAYAQAIVTFLTNYATYGQLVGEDL